MKQKWIKFIVKQYNKYYSDPISDMINKLNNKSFKSRTEAFVFMKHNSFGGLKKLMYLADKDVRRRADYGKRRNNKRNRYTKTNI